MLNEADTCRKYIVPCLQASGWDNDPHSITEQRCFTEAGQPDADPFDLLCHLAFNAPVLTRRQRADRVTKKQAAFFNDCPPEAREISTDSVYAYRV